MQQEGELTSTACWESEEERCAEAWNLRKAWARLVAARVRAPGRSVSRSSARWPSVNASRLLHDAVRRTCSSALRAQTPTPTQQLAYICTPSEQATLQA